MGKDFKDGGGDCRHSRANLHVIPAKVVIHRGGGEGDGVLCFGRRSTTL